jgi:peroxiredoxin
LPSLENLHKQFKDDEFVLLAVDVGEKREVVQKFIEKNGYSFLNILDEDKNVSALYGVISHPMKFLINKKGELIGFARGYREWDADEMKLLITSLLKQ